MFSSPLNEHFLPAIFLLKTYAVVLGGVLVLGGSKRDEESEAQPWCGPERDNCWDQRGRLGN